MYEKGKKNLWWEGFSQQEVVAHAKKCDIALLPVGSIEQHGGHLPTGEDSWHAIRISERVAEKTGVMLLPCPWYGTHPYMQWYFPGTIPLRHETFVNLLIDIVHGSSYAGFNKFIIFNCHGQTWPILQAVNELALEGYFLIGVTLWDIIRETIHKVLEGKVFGHADESETSLGLYLIPEYVHMEKAHRDEVPETLIDRKWFYPFGSLLPKNRIDPFSLTAHRPYFKSLKYGVHGHPTKGTAEKGEKMVNAAVKWLVEIIEEIKRRYPPGVKPAVK